MPATEKTWRDQIRMHVIFGVSSLVMLVGTVWMLAKDHNREWRQTGLADRAKERWTAAAQLAQESAVSQSDLAELQERLAAAQAAHVSSALVDRFKARVTAEDQRLADAGREESRADFGRFDAAAAAVVTAADGTSEAVRARTNLKNAMGRFVHEAKRREDALTAQRKFKAADQTAAISERGIAVGEGRPRSAIKRIEARIDDYAEEIAEMDVAVAAAKSYRQDLEAVVREIDADEVELQRQIATIETNLERLRENVAANTTTPGDWFNRWPVLDALYNGNIKLEQIWLPDITINYNFSSVARYDRCINCHRSIAQTAPGSATEPAYPAIPKGERVRTVQLSTPDAPPGAESEDAEDAESPTLEAVYGLGLAPRGQIDRYAVTIQVVLPESPAARAGLETGDIIEKINGGSVYTAEAVKSYLLELAEWGRPLELSIRRGLDQPFTSHPRLDLFVGDSSPHPQGAMGCTICHDGQGSATDFKWASHTPNNPDQALEWSRQHGWFDNHHWIFPMSPARFAESNCLKCHHEVVELEPSERFPDPPAPKLLEGYQLVREFGCYGCHEINGYDGPDHRIGPDLRLQPNYYEAAAQILSDPGLDEQQREWAMTLVHTADDQAVVRSQLARSIRQDAASPNESRLTKATHALADLLKDVDIPGELRKVGPSLRHLDAKVDYDWLYSWIRRPADFRPSTRMPQFFGHDQHLEKHLKEFTIVDVQGNEREVTDQEYTARFEAIEIRALTDFLLANSQPFEYLDPPAGVTEGPSAERGKWLFESRGCLACHSHADFPGIASDQGPDLSRIAAKFNSGKGQRWLYSWLRQPNRYHTQTVMPNLYLEPVAETDATGTPTGRVSDPAADIVAYLLGVQVDWRPEAVAPSRELTAEEEKALEDLTAVWLSASFPRRRAEEFAREGIPARLAATVKVDEQMLVNMTPADRVERQLAYVARRSLSRYGCFGCHDIPGYEDAKPIGTTLANWGRKDTSQLAFENISTFLATHGVEEDGSDAPHGAHGGGHGHGLDTGRYDPDTGYFLQSLNSHQRPGFLWQKLRMPRSYDFATTRTKRYDERLRMPKFPLTPRQREAVMTFMLGLVSEPPAEKYIYNPGPRQEAIVQGRHVLDKYNCAGCHVLDLERWQIAFEPDTFDDPPEAVDYPFLAADFSDEQIAASLRRDRRGLLHAELYGMVTRSEETGEPSRVDEDGVPLEPDDTESDPFYEFVLYQPTVVGGAPRLIGPPNLPIPASRDGLGPASGQAFPAKGGDLTWYLYPRVIAEIQKTNPDAKGSEAWSWLPPALHDEGQKVQTDWLHDFLMDPTAIRPPAVMRMPNFHMSSVEASKLVNYFAAKSGAEFPYEYNSRRRGDYLARLERDHPSLLDDAMKIVTDVSYCVQCHAVGDYQPKGAVTTFGPKLDEVYRRLRPDYVRRWIANPLRILPYTGMPVNIRYDPEAPHRGGVSQDLFPGTSIQQLDGLVDLLMNFDEYARRRTSVRGLVRETPAAPGTTGAFLPRDDQPERR